MGAQQSTTVVVSTSSSSSSSSNIYPPNDGYHLVDNNNNNNNINHDRGGGHQGSAEQQHSNIVRIPVDASHPILSQFYWESAFGPGSGRMMKTYRLRGGGGGGRSSSSNSNTGRHHRSSSSSNASEQQQRRTGSSSVGSTTTTTTGVTGSSSSSTPPVVLVMKMGWISTTIQQDTDYLREAVIELERIRTSTAHLPHVLPFTAWFGPEIAPPPASPSATSAAAAATNRQQQQPSMGSHPTGGDATTAPLTTTTAGGGYTAEVGSSAAASPSSANTSVVSASTTTSAGAAQLAPSGAFVGAASAVAASAGGGGGTASSSTTQPSHPAKPQQPQQQTQQQQQNSHQPVYLMRPFVYTTLSDRLTCRPWLHVSEKLWLTYQILEAVASLHEAPILHEPATIGTGSVVHGALSLENVGLTSTGYVYLIDIGSYKAKTSLPDDDPSEYLYYFAPQHASSADGGGGASSSSSNNPGSGGGGSYDDWTTTSNTGSNRGRSTRCSLAPERFRTGRRNNAHHDNNSSSNKDPPLTTAMDVFSLGCLIAELFLNGEPCLDLGTLMDYRRNGAAVAPAQHSATSATSPSTSSSSIMPPSLIQKLNKIESSTIRAACKHMLQLDPNRRLTARQYLNRLRASHQGDVERALSVTTKFVQRVTANQHHQQRKDDKEGIDGGDDNESRRDDAANDDDDVKNLIDVSAPPTFDNCAREISPDARIAVAARYYPSILWECLGTTDESTTRYLRSVLGRASFGDDNQDEDQDAQGSTTDRWGDNSPTAVAEKDLLAETEALLKRLNAITRGEAGQVDDDDSEHDEKTDMKRDTVTRRAPQAPVSNTSNKRKEERSALCQSCVLIYLQVILSTVRHVQRPASKIVALKIMESLGRHCGDDEARLQRIVPVTVSLLQDSDALVRANTVRVLTDTVSVIETFSPSDSKVFSQYVFKRVSSCVSDPCLVVRLAFAGCIASLAETAHRFLDVSHAVRLYEAVGSTISAVNGAVAGGAARNTVGEELKNRGRSAGGGVFAEDIAKLLDAAEQPGPLSSSPSSSGDVNAKTVASQRVHSNSPSGIVAIATGKTLVSSTYATDLSALHETVSRWVVHLTTDQSEHASLPKRAMLGDLGRLCAFFGLDGVMGFILPQILAFLNDRKDWELRAALFEHMPSVCHIIGRAATEEYVLPCVEIGLVDGQEQVIGRALSCLASLVELGLLSRTALLGGGVRDGGGRGGSTAKSNDNGLLRKYGALLLHPSADIRRSAAEAFVVTCRALGALDCEAYAIPGWSPLFRFQPNASMLESIEGMERCLSPAWSRGRFEREVRRIASARDRSSGASSSSGGAWTSIRLFAEDDEVDAQGRVRSPASSTTATQISEHTQSLAVRQNYVDINHDERQRPQVRRVLEFVRMLLKHTAHQSPIQDRNTRERASKLLNCIEGSGKLAQCISFPRQDAGNRTGLLPDWYATLRDLAVTSQSLVSESSAVRSVSTLGSVYGLSIMGTSSDNIAGRSNDENQAATDFQKKAIQSEDSRCIEAAYAGQWGSEVVLDPEVIDTSLLVTKLKALHVPPLPVKLGNQASRRVVLGKEPASMSTSWKPKMNVLLATSMLVSGHSAPVTRLAVSKDQAFFVSGSHDGTCRVWDLPRLEDSVGILESCRVYSGHSDSRSTRVNDVAMLEGSHSLVSGASDGSVHVWRVEVVTAQSSKAQGDQQRQRNDRPRVVGTSLIRNVDHFEGEVLAVSHFNSMSESVAIFATQRGTIHSWDLRCAVEPFALKHSAELGHLTSMAPGNDRNWIVTGTSRGFLALWDIRFQQATKLWRHESGAPINRLATSFVPPPQSWSSPSSEPRPFFFVAAGCNECAMFDAVTGMCRESFRTTAGDSRNLNAHVADPPAIEEVAMSSRSHNRSLKAARRQPLYPLVAPQSSINCMVGSIGANDHSYLITGGSDCHIRYWNFALPQKCYRISGPSAPTFYERIDFEGQRRLMLCRESSSNLTTRHHFHGLKKPSHHHIDSILDLKIIDNSLISCSRDCTVKVWR